MAGRWPGESVRRLTDYDWSLIPAEVQEKERFRKVGSVACQPRPTKCKVRFARIDDKRHPANGQFGAFAATTLHPGDLIVDYIGVIKPQENAEADSSCYALSFAPGLVCDAADAGNEARFVNDAHGVPPAAGGGGDGPSPNAVFKRYWADVGGGRCERRVGYFCCRRKVRKGEEVLTSYGKGFGFG